MDGVEFPIAHAQTGLEYGRPLVQAAPMPELAASITQPAAMTLTLGLPQLSKQFTTATRVGVDLPVNPLMALQAGDGSDLFGASSSLSAVPRFGLGAQR